MLQPAAERAKRGESSKSENSMSHSSPAENELIANDGTVTDPYETHIHTRAKVQSAKTHGSFVKLLFDRFERDLLMFENLIFNGMG